MSTAWLFEQLAGYGDAAAIAFGDRVVSYRRLVEQVAKAREELNTLGVRAGEVAALYADYSPEAVAALLAMTQLGAIAVPITAAAMHQAPELEVIADVQVKLQIDAAGVLSAERRDRGAAHTLFGELRARQAPGLVLFTSGSTGKSKGVVHDLARLLEKFQVRRQTLRTLSFLLFDHIGGLNTLFYTLSNGGFLVIPEDHRPDTVAGAIARHQVQLLPTSPTFLNLLLLSGAAERFDLSSLQLVTYGTEPMPQSTLERIAAALSHVKLQQTYGLSELGILRSRSDDNASLWVKLGGEGFEIKVHDGLLYIRARSAMLGYLNAPSPFDEEGWFCTGDEVEQNGEYYLIKGRRSETINVGGQKVYPAEVESVIAQLENVRDVTVFGDKHPILGQAVACKVNLVQAEDPKAFRGRLRKFCHERMASFKVPVRVEITSDVQYNARHKRMRRQ